MRQAEQSWQEIIRRVSTNDWLCDTHLQGVQFPQGTDPKGTFFPSVETPRRSPCFAAKQKASEHDDDSQAVCTLESGPFLMHTPGNHARHSNIVTPLP